MTVAGISRWGLPRAKYRRSLYGEGLIPLDPPEVVGPVSFRIEVCHRNGLEDGLFSIPPLKEGTLAGPLAKAAGPYLEGPAALS